MLILEVTVKINGHVCFSNAHLTEDFTSQLLVTMVERSNEQVYPHIRISQSFSLFPRNFHDLRTEMVHTCAHAQW